MIRTGGATSPWAMIVGQDLMHLSLALNAINPGIGWEVPCDVSPTGCAKPRMAMGIRTADDDHAVPDVRNACG